MPTRKHNPGFLTDDELVATFCVRTSEFESIAETLRENDRNSNHHLIVIGPRGSGKTSLLLRVAVEVRRNRELSSRLFPITFAEESYEVGTCGEFWLECLDRLARQAPQAESTADLRRTWEDLRMVQDDWSLSERCLGALLDLSDHIGKRLVLLVENLNMMLGDMDRDSGWRLRKTLQTEPRIILLGSATSRFAEIDHPDQPLYDLFRVISLRPLNTNECGVLWNSICGESSPYGKIRSLEILTGGSPRLIAIVAQFGAGHPFHELMDDLLALIDEHTEYFKSHLDSLPHQERRIYLALADLWKPATTREIADRARLGSSTSSAHLKRLIYRGVVAEAGGTARRKQYYLVERLYNVYYLLRRRGTARVVEALLRVMTALYSQSELVQRVLTEAERTNKRYRSFYRETLSQLSSLPQMTGYRDVLLKKLSSLPLARPMTALVSIGVPKTSIASIDSSESEIGTKNLKLVSHVCGLEDLLAQYIEHKKYSSALLVCDEIISLASSSETYSCQTALVKALVHKGAILVSLHRSEEAVRAYDELARRFESSDEHEINKMVARALAYKALTISQLSRFEDALEAYDDVVRRFAANKDDEIVEQVATALVNKGNTYGQLRRFEEAIEVFDEVIESLAASESSHIASIVAVALMNKGATLADLGRSEEQLEVYDELVQRLESSNFPEVSRKLAEALVNKGITLSEMGRHEEAIEVYYSTIERLESSDAPEIVEIVARVLLNIGVTLGHMGRYEEQIDVYDEVQRQFSTSDTPTVVAQVAKAIVNKGFSVGRLGRTEKALEIYDDLVERFESSEIPEIGRALAQALMNKAVTLRELGRHEEELEVYDRVVKRFRSSDVPEIVEIVARVLGDRAPTLGKLGRIEEELKAYDDVVARLESSDTPKIVEIVASVLMNKGVRLGQLGRTEKELEVYNEVVNRFEAYNIPGVIDVVVNALVNKGISLGKLGRAQEELQTYAEIAKRHNSIETEHSSEIVAQALVLKGVALGHVIRSGEKSDFLANQFADVAEFESDVSAILAFYLDFESFPDPVVQALIVFSALISPARILELLKHSEATEKLLPLVTALQQESGLRPRVAREVEEVSQDIRSEFRRLREFRYQRSKTSVSE